MSTRLALVAALLLTACGGNNEGNNTNDLTLVGTWESQVDTVRLRAVFTGKHTSGTFALSQFVPGDTATCETGIHSEGMFTNLNKSLVLPVASGHQTTSAGCSGGATDTPVSDLMPLQNFADALSGPYVLTETTVKLGSSYPMFTRVP
jgi:hypothetical protein